MCYQAAQLAYVINERLKETTEDAEKEKALEGVSISTAKDKSKAVVAAKKKAQEFEKAQALGEKRLMELDVKLRGTELKLAEAESLNLAQVDEITDLKAALEACDEKWYNNGFADAENSIKPIVYKARQHEFEDGWMAVLQAMGVPDDSLLRHLEQIPFPPPSPPFQS